MSSGPQPGRHKQPPSPTHPQQPMMPLRPPPRSAQYPPRYYRPTAPGPSPSPKLGWTPRTAASPHTPVTPRSHSRPPTSSGHHSVFSQPPPAASPRLNVSAPGISKPGIKPNLSPIPISPTVSAHTPSWLKGNYKPQTPKTPSTEPATIEQLCARRLDEIKKTINGENEDSELFEVMHKLDFAKVADEYERLTQLQDIYFKGRERKRKAEADLFRTEREIQRIDHVAEHVNSKIARLRSYARFIESGWADEEALQPRSPTENGAKATENTNGNLKLEPQNDLKQEDVKQEDVKQEDMKQEDVETNHAASIS